MSRDLLILVLLSFLGLMIGFPLGYYGTEYLYVLLS